MSETITVYQIINALKYVIKKLDEKREELDRLDSPIGDGDHGRTMTTAFHSIIVLLEPEGENIGSLLSKIGRSLALSGGASVGPLYGTGFMEAGRSVEGKDEIGLKDLAQMLKAFENGIIKRGKAQVREKTMLDAVHPVVTSLELSMFKNLPLREALLDMKEAARAGMESTKNMIALRGRSSRLGERSIGHIDPGAASYYFIIEAAVDCLTK